MCTVIALNRLLTCLTCGPEPWARQESGPQSSLQRWRACSPTTSSTFETPAARCPRPGWLSSEFSFGIVSFSTAFDVPGIVYHHGSLKYLCIVAYHCLNSSCSAWPSTWPSWRLPSQLLGHFTGLLRPFLGSATTCFFVLPSCWGCEPPMFRCPRRARTDPPFSPFETLKTGALQEEISSEQSPTPGLLPGCSGGCHICRRAPACRAADFSSLVGSRSSEHWCGAPWTDARVHARAGRLIYTCITGKLPPSAFEADGRRIVVWAPIFRRLWQPWSGALPARSSLQPFRPECCATTPSLPRRPRGHGQQSSHAHRSTV